jgi:glutamate dehydrogenase
VSRYRIVHDQIDELKRTQNNILDLLETMLRNPTLPNTSLLRLTLLENLSPRELELLTALIEFENQLVPSFNEVTITNILIKHHAITKALLNYFFTKFNPSMKYRKREMSRHEERIKEMLHPITHITEDQVIRTLFEIIQQMARTNFFLNKPTIAFKVHTHKIVSKMVGIQPHIEAFVHHYRLSGVHLRMGSVSRGGIRWSDRFEDFRVEVRSLMLTQEGKNAIIIPSGAKGGFIIRLPKEEITHETFTHFYELYIDALLDLVDNQKEHRTIVDPRIIRYDEDDTYFVVAADKGTAHMSDVANAIALRRGFWLGDAFASGGSNGYNHKKLGITAKGALRSVERFFIEEGINFYETPITVIGIGSMNGDVFGNGMLQSRYFKLLAAISHNEIFIDPDPNPEIAYQERKRLFEASPKGGWRYYNPKKISKGGGVFNRNDKEIPLSTEIQKLFKTTRQSMSGEEMVQTILRLKVDMFFNGGVGTYVKASWESNLDVGDKANENVRINASELKARTVCEGGNLGLTLPARIEYAKLGGFINLDAIDNSAGVNTSDYEVNLKIALGELQQKGLIDEKSRLETLQHHAQMVTESVLWTNYHQSLAISLDYRRSQKDILPFLDMIALLEHKLPIFNRQRFHIPKDEKFSEILDATGGIVRPILGTLLSYAKIFVKRRLLASTILEEPFAQEYLLKYFPKSFATIYEEEIINHPLKREIAATVIANRVINTAGITFISDFDTLGEERFLSKIKSYLICNQLFDCNKIRYEIFQHDYRIPASQQYDLLFEIETTLAFSVNWMMHHLQPDQIHAPTLLRYKSELSTLMALTPDDHITSVIPEAPHLNRFFYHLPYMKFTIAAIILHEKNHRRFDETARLMHAIIQELHINEILEALENYQSKKEEEHTIKKQLKEFVEFTVTSLSEKVIHYQRKDETIEEALQNYLQDYKERYQTLQIRFKNFLDQTEIQALEDVAILVNSLIQLTLDNPL